MLDGSFLHRSASNSDPPSLETQINCISGNCQKNHIFPTGYYGINTGSLRDKYGLWKTWFFFWWIQNTGLIRDKYGLIRDKYGFLVSPIFSDCFFHKIMNSYHICPRMNGSGSKKCSNLARMICNGSCREVTWVLARAPANGPESKDVCSALNNWRLRQS